MSSLRVLDISMVQGDTFRLVVRCKQPNGNPVNLAGYTVAWQVRDRPSSATTVASSTGVSPNATVSVTDPASGEILLQTNAMVDAGLYYYDVQITSSGGIRETILRGSLRVAREVTR